MPFNKHAAFRAARKKHRPDDIIDTIIVGLEEEELHMMVDELRWPAVFNLFAWITMIVSVEFLFFLRGVTLEYPIVGWMFLIWDTALCVCLYYMVKMVLVASDVRDRLGELYQREHGGGE